MNRNVKYTLYILKKSLNRAEPYYNRRHEVSIAWAAEIKALTRGEAVFKLLPEIGKLLDTISDPSIKYVSVFCGEKRLGNAERLTPIQVEVKSRRLRSDLEL